MSEGKINQALVKNNVGLVCFERVLVAVSARLIVFPATKT
jgi:hypothetical protein